MTRTVNPAWAALSAAQRPLSPAPITSRSIMVTLCLLIIAIEIGEWARCTLIRQMVDVEQAQVDQFVQPFLLELLAPEDGRKPFPPFLQEITQKQVGIKRGK